MGIFATLSAEPAAVQRFIDRVLGPLDGERPARAAEMLATLEALIAARNVGEAAQLLGVHRHTVVYRMARLKQLGVDVDDPGQRNRIWLALRCRRLLQT